MKQNDIISVRLSKCQTISQNIVTIVITTKENKYNNVYMCLYEQNSMKMWLWENREYWLYCKQKSCCKIMHWDQERFLKEWRPNGMVGKRE